MTILISILLAAFGVWTGLHGALLLIAGGTPLLMLLFLAEGVLALAAAWGVARAAAWAPALLLALGALFAADRLLQAFVLGIRPWLFALLSAVVALLAAVVAARLARRAGGAGS